MGSVDLFPLKSISNYALYYYNTGRANTVVRCTICRCGALGVLSASAGGVSMQRYVHEENNSLVP